MKTVFATLALALTIGSQASAFTLNSQSSSSFRGWADANITFQFNSANCPAGVDVSGIISDAFNIWNNVASSRVHLSLVGTTTSTTYANPITIMCDTNYGSSSPGAADSSPGAASVLPSSGDSITSGIMYLNASSGRANIGNLSRALVAVVLAHEIGHLLGLGHSQDVNALMYYDASSKTNLALAQDDIDGVSYLYPRDELGGDKPMGCGLIQNQKPPPPQSKWLLLAMMLTPALFAIWLRRTRPRGLHRSLSGM